MSRRRRWWIAAAVVGISVVVGLVVLLAPGGSSSCAPARVGPAEVPVVFSPPDSAVVRTDPALVRLVAALRRDGFGRVIGAVGYDQTQWLHVAALSDGFAAWTAGNAVVGFLDPFGKARWGLRQTTDQQGWAVVRGDFVSLDLRHAAPAAVTALGGSSGHVLWCTALGRVTHAGQPLTLAPADSGGLWIVTAGPSLSRVDGEGRVRRERLVTGVDRGAYVREVGSMVIVGGRADHLLTAPDPSIAPPTAVQSAVTAFDAASLRPRWQWGPGVSAHVIGQADRKLVVERVVGHRLGLLALDLAGHERWSVTLPPGTTADMALVPVADAVLTRTAHAIRGFSAASGRLLWTAAVNDGFPDGFSLAAQPALGSSVLLGMTSGLGVLDPSTGAISRYRLPADGTTFWPYQLATSGHSVIVATNAGAVLVSVASVASVADR